VLAAGILAQVDQGRAERLVADHLVARMAARELRMRGAHMVRFELLAKYQARLGQAQDLQQGVEVAAQCVHHGCRSIV
jgi:hypothetical protein